MLIKDPDEPWNVCESPPFGKFKPKLGSMEGIWRLVSTEHMEEVLEALGITPMVAIMVMRSDMMLTIYEDIDKQWKILTETSIKAKSIRGYRTRNYKMTANKFIPGEAKPELLEDWDPRIVVTTLTHDYDDVEANGEGVDRLILDQVAEKDLKFAADSSVVFQGNGDDVMTMTMTVFGRPNGPVVGHRKFLRYTPQEQLANGAAHTNGIGTENGHQLQVPKLQQNGRKMSSPF